MVCVMIGLLYVYFWIMRGNFNKFPVDVLPEFRGDDGVSVFGRIHYVVVAQIDAMTHSSIILWLGHTFSVA